MDPKKAVKYLKKIKKTALELEGLANQFDEIENNTVDMQLVITDANRLSQYARKNILTKWQFFRIRHRRPSPHLITMMKEVGKEFSEFAQRIGLAWRYPDNEMQRGTEEFKRRERIYAGSRDSYYSLSELNELGFEIEKRFGSHEHLLSERGFKWLNIIIGFLIGVVTPAIVAFIKHYLHL